MNLATKLKIMKNTLTAVEFENAGYSRADAARLAADPAMNWKARNGGARTNRNNWRKLASQKNNPHRKKLIDVRPHPPKFSPV